MLIYIIQIANINIYKLFIESFVVIIKKKNIIELIKGGEQLSAFMMLFIIVRFITNTYQFI